MVIIMNDIPKFEIYVNKLKSSLKRIIYTNVNTMIEYVQAMSIFKVDACIYCHKSGNIHSKGSYPTEN